MGFGKVVISLLSFFYISLGTNDNDFDKEFIESIQVSYDEGNNSSNAETSDIEQSISEFFSETCSERELAPQFRALAQNEVVYISAIANQEDQDLMNEVLEGAIFYFNNFITEHNFDMPQLAVAQISGADISVSDLESYVEFSLGRSIFDTENRLLLMGLESGLILGYAQLEDKNRNNCDDEGFQNIRYRSIILRNYTSNGSQLAVGFFNPFFMSDEQVPYLGLANSNGSFVCINRYNFSKVPPNLGEVRDCEYTDHITALEIILVHELGHIFGDIYEDGHDDCGTEATTQTGTIGGSIMSTSCAYDDRYSNGFSSIIYVEFDESTVAKFSRIYGFRE